ncbi:glycoside hydrolase family 26 protein [Terriglobus aquaticus]|nr:hypothetical protein [Terriglobus aquaticus]
MKAAILAVGLFAATLGIATPALRRAQGTVPEVNLQDSQPLPRAHYGRRLEPAGNTVLHGAGQTDWASFAAYRNAVAPAQPVVFMTYVDLRDDLPGFFAQLRGTLSTEPALTPQIGLSMNRGQAQLHYESETAAGTDDYSIGQLCNGLQSLHRPVFLRPGYEFNGSWNGYQPTAYVAAFRRIASRVHACAPQTAIVWDWSVDAELDTEAGGNTAPANSRWQAFYPGSSSASDVADSVDWWALNLFTSAGIRSAAAEQFLQAAAASHHPVMIAESSPRGYNVTRSSNVWSDWFAPYFALVHTHPGIRAFCYINWDWSAYPQWSDWGNARIETAPPTLQRQLRNELTRPLYNAALPRS